MCEGGRLNLSVPTQEKCLKSIWTLRKRQNLIRRKGVLVVIYKVKVDYVIALLHIRVVARNEKK